MFRKTIFWAHLICGATAGLVILMMSVTGVALTFERQILAWADQSYHAAPEAGQERLPIDTLVAASAERSNFSPSSVALSSDPAAPAVLRAGRSGSLYLNPYSGEIYSPQNESLHSFFGTVTSWHRWFNASGDSRGIARAITGASNLMFLFLIVSGLYLWLPRIYRWAAFRMRLLFTKSPNSAARDFNWHHVFGIWAAIPLLVIVATATVFYYPWANALVYQLAGEEVPSRQGPGSGSGQVPVEAPASVHLPLEVLFMNAAQEVDDWQTLTLNLPQPGSSTVSFSVDQGNGGQPQKRHTLILDAGTGDLVSFEPFSSQSAGRQARSWVRFLHTGEALGILGQLVAGLASLAGAIMVWTGLALALRRLNRSVARRRIQAEMAGTRQTS